MSEKLQVGDIARPWGLTIAPEVRIEKALETGGYRVSWFDSAMRPCSCTVADDEVVLLRRRDPNAPEEVEVEEVEVPTKPKRTRKAPRGN